jgi:hypothetical protein
VNHFINYSLRYKAGFIKKVYRIIAAIGKHVIAEDTLSGRCKCIGVEEAADLGVVITGLQVIEPGILGADIAIGAIFALLPLVFKTENQGCIVRL